MIDCCIHYFYTGYKKLEGLIKTNNFLVHHIKNIDDNLKSFPHLNVTSFKRRKVQQ